MIRSKDIFLEEMDKWKGDEIYVQQQIWEEEQRLMRYLRKRHPRKRKKPKFGHGKTIQYKRRTYSYSDKAEDPFILHLANRAH